MGHCFSCLRTPSVNIDVNSHEVVVEKDEMTEIIPTFQMPASVLTEYPQQGTLQPLLENFESQVNGNRKSTSSSYNNFSSIQPNNANTSAFPIQCESVINVQRAPASSEKSQKSFYHKLPSIPRSVSAMGSGESRISETKIVALFEVYKDAVEDAILTEGIEKLCNDLQLNPDEFKVLILAWKLNAGQMCCFTRSEFVQGLKNMKVDSLKGIQARLPEVISDLEKDSELYRDLYRFTFKFGLDVASGQRILPADVAIVLWRLVFTVCEPPILNRWLNYLEQHPHVRGIPKDTWYMFLNFCESVGMDLSSYDDTEAWPSLFDDFVEFENDQMNQNISKTDVIKKED